MAMIYSRPKPVSHDAVTELIFLEFVCMRQKPGTILRVSAAPSCERMELYTKRCSWHDLKDFTLLVLACFLVLVIGIPVFMGSWLL